jgi:hypothetical protein
VSRFFVYCIDSCVILRTNLDSLEMTVKKNMMIIVRRIALVAVISMLGFAVVPAAASAAPSCYGSSCEGRDPAATNCVNDAYTILSRNAVTSAGNWGNLELRYSLSCYSNWVRFTPWYGIRAWLDGISGGLVAGNPWIWRAGVANSLRGVINSSGTLGFGYTNWTAMVTAAGTTCSSVGVYYTEPSSSGQGERRSLGTYNAPCIS